MHFMSQLRYNPKTQSEEWYYRIKESFRDRTDRVRNRVMLNVGFIDEPHRPEDIRDIGKCLPNVQRIPQFNVERVDFLHIFHSRGFCNTASC